MNQRRKVFVHALLCPHFAPFRAVGANIYLVPTFQNGCSELPVGGAVPNIAERQLAEISHSVRGVFVETAGHHHAVPGDDAGMPEFPAVVGQQVFDLVRSLLIAPVAGVFFLQRYERMAILVIIHLSRFELDLIHAYLAGQPESIGNLMLIGAHHQKLKNDVWCGRPERFFPFDYIGGALQHLVQIAFFAVLLIHLLRGAVQRNDEPVQALSLIHI